MKYLLQTQVNAELLSSVVNACLTERLGNSYEHDEVFPEWKPLKNLLDFVEGISDQQNYCLLSGKKESVHPNGSLGNSLGDVNRLLGGGDDHRVAETTVAFICSIVCENTDKVSTNLPSGVVISRDLLDDCEIENPFAIQSHLNLALLDLEDDAVSISSTEQSVSLEVYLQGRHFFTVISWRVI